MATIERVGKRWRVRQFLNGKLRTIARCSTKPDAEVILRRLEEEERGRSRVVSGSLLPLSEVLVRWRKAKVGLGNDPLHTQAAERKLLTLATKQGWQSTASITALAVSDYRSSGGSVGACRFLSAVLRWAHDTLDQYVDPKALIALKGGRTARRPSPVLMTAEEVSAAEQRAARMSANAAALVHCLSTYGWRPITAAKMTVADFDPFAGAITCKVKGGDTVRHLLLPETTTRLRWLVANAKPTDALFLDPRTGQAWSLADGISPWAKNHLRIKVYDLKRYAISSMLDRGIPAHTVALFTGHRTISQVLRYARSNEAKQRAALDVILGKSRESQSNAAEQQGPATSGKHGINAGF